MPCCGSQRNQIKTLRTAQGGTGQAPTVPNRSPPVRVKPVVYQYTGQASVTMVGAATGRHYRFQGPGARIEVDARDAYSLRASPHLRRL